MPAPRSVYIDDARLPSLRDLAGPLFRYWRASALVFLATISATLAVAALSTPTWESRMTILVKRERVDPIMSSASEKDSPTPRVEVTESELYSEIQLLTSRDVLERVATRVGMIPPGVGSPADTQEARLSRAVRRLNASLSVQPLRKTTMIAVSYRAPKPEQAEAVLTNLAQEYLAKHLTLHRPPGARQFFEDQTARMHAELRAAEAKLNEFSARERVVSASGERESTMKTVGDFETTLQQTEASIADATRRIGAIDGELATTPGRHVTQVRDGGNLEVVRTLRSQLLQLQLKRSELLQKFTPQYFTVVQVEADIARVQAALTQAEEAPLRDATTDQNPTYQWLVNERARVRTERDALLARAESLRRTVSEYRDRAQRLGSQSLQQQELLLQVKAAEENYLLYQRKQEEARIADELDRTRIANVAISEPPTIPQFPRSLRPLILLVGTAAATFLALAAAFILHALNPHFRTPDEVYRVLDVPVLASLPAPAD